MHKKVDSSWSLRQKIRAKFTIQMVIQKLDLSGLTACTKRCEMFYSHAPREASMKMTGKLEQVS